MKDQITLAVGDGGKAMRDFLGQHVHRKLSGEFEEIRDAADLGVVDGSLAMTTDSFVVSPLFFPGGDIGKLAVCGTINDLAVAGAEPHCLTLSLIIEEGFSLIAIDTLLDSVADACRECDVPVVAGDTKVVPRGAADGLFINTTGIGRLRQPTLAGPARIEEGVDLIVSGPIGEHGLAVLCAREELGFEPMPRSDCRPLHRIAGRLHERLGEELVAMRDATRGGVAAVLHEWAEACSMAMWIDESAIPLAESSRGVCEALGLDPLFMACEGTFVAAVRHSASATALEIMGEFSFAAEARVIGRAQARSLSPVVVRRAAGIDQPLDEPLTMLPRIC